MPKSKLRGGAKAHRKRVQKRNETMIHRQRTFQRQYQEELEKQMELYKTQLSGETENEEVSTDQPLNLNV